MSHPVVARLTAAWIPLLLNCAAVASDERPRYEATDMQAVRDRLEAFAPFELRYDDSRLSEAEKKAIERLVRAGRLVDRIFLEQMFPGNDEIFRSLRERYREQPTAENRALLEYFWLNKGPYDLSSDEAPNERFLDGPGIPAELDPGRGFYPPGTTLEKLDAWLETLDAPQRNLATSDFTVIRGAAGSGHRFEAVPYSAAYRESLEPLAGELVEAAAILDGTLARFLSARADALRTNDYEASEALWIRLNGPKDDSGSNLDVTIGPYENYMDEIQKQKAAFQFYLTVLRPDKTEAMQLFREHVHAMDEYLWERFQQTYGREGVVRWVPPGDDVTLVAVDVAYAAGMGNQSFQTLGFNLPNIAAWQERYGTKKVMLMNVLDGKFEKILRPIADRVLDPKHAPDVVSHLFTDNTVRHEVAHGIGPSTLLVTDGGERSETVTDAAGREVRARRVDVRDRLKRYYSAFEEAKAEVVSLLFGYWLEEKGLVDAEYTRRMASTYVASTFRTIRFGATSDHARGKVFEFNRLTDYGAIHFDRGRFRIDHTRFPAAVDKLAMDILAVQVFGDVESAAFLLRTDGHPRRNVRVALETIEAADIPVDLRVRYTLGDNYTVIDPIGDGE